MLFWIDIKYLESSLSWGSNEATQHYNKKKLKIYSAKRKYTVVWSIQKETESLTQTKRKVHYKSFNWKVYLV